MLSREHLTHRLTGGQTLTLGHRCVSFIGLREQTEDHERHGGRKDPGDRSELHHNYRLKPAPDGMSTTSATQAASRARADFWEANNYSRRLESEPMTVRRCRCDARLPIRRATSLLQAPRQRADRDQRPVGQVDACLRVRFLSLVRVVLRRGHRAVGGHDDLVLPLDSTWAWDRRLLESVPDSFRKPARNQRNLPASDFVLGGVVSTEILVICR